MSHKFVAGAGLLVLAGWGISGLAVAGSDIKQVDLTLRILVDGPPPCSVKGSAVKFGNVIINRIDGTNYQQDAKYTLNCGNKVSYDLRMQLKGNTAVINGETVLSTDIAGLGVRIENATSVSRAIRWARWKAFRNAIGAKALDWFGGRAGTFGGNR